MSELSLVLDQDAHDAGERVRGHVEVLENVEARRLEAVLVFIEDSNGHRALAHRAAVRLHDGVLLSGRVFSFHLDLPEDAPPNFEGEEGQLFWAVVARAECATRLVEVVKRISVRSRGAEAANR